MQDTQGQCLLATAERAEVGHLPIEANEPQQALHEACRLPQRHAEQHFRREAGLNGGVTLETAVARPCRPPLPPTPSPVSNQIVSEPQRLSALLIPSRFKLL
jgi:hypothetical protein